MIYRKFSLVVLLSMLSGPALTQSASVYVDIGPCMAMDNDSERYACYDLLEEQIRASQARETQLPVLSLPRGTRQQQAEAETVSRDEAAEQNAAEFGLETASTSFGREANARILENENGDEELRDTIASLEQRVPNQWEINLAGGQVWSQVNSKRYRLQEGMEVRIYPSPFGGSFRLSAANLNGFIQVRRIQ